jgi:hypothetical protein
MIYVKNVLELKNIIGINLIYILELNDIIIIIYNYYFYAVKAVIL